MTSHTTPEFGSDVVQVNPFAEELIEVLLESHGDSGSFLTDVSPAIIANSLHSNELVGATGFEPATPCAQAVIYAFSCDFLHSSIWS